jgi:F-type H+-transporting ATPase subunit c
MVTLLVVMAATFGPSAAFAQEGAPDVIKGWIGLGAGLAIGIAAAGGGMGQGRAVAGAMESIGRNPNSASKIQTPMIIGLAFIESLVIYALVIAFLLQGKI